MSGTRWTPGPWMTDGARRQMWVDEHGKPRASGAIAIFEATCGIACVAVAVPGCLPAIGNEDAARANAYLTASAPDLYEALEAILDELRPSYDCGHFNDATMKAYRAGRAALQRARGEG